MMAGPLRLSAGALKRVTISKFPLKTESGVGEKSYFSDCGFRIDDLLDLKRFLCPGQLQRDEVIFGRRVAIHMKARLQLGGDLHFTGCSALDGQFVDRAYRQYALTLRQ